MVKLFHIPRASLRVSSQLMGLRLSAVAPAKVKLILPTSGKNQFDPLIHALVGI